MTAPMAALRPLLAAGHRWGGSRHVRCAALAPQLRASSIGRNTAAWLSADTRSCASTPAATPPAPPVPGVQSSAGAASSVAGVEPPRKFYRERLLDGEEEVLTEEEKAEKEAILKELTVRLSGPLADEHGNVPTGKDRPIAIEVDGPSHFYANSKRYTAYTKLKHRLLTRMGYKVLHVPYFEWRRLRGAREREDYMRAKLQEEPSEWLDPEDEKYYTQPPEEGEEEVSFKPQQAGQPQAGAPPTPPAPLGRQPEQSSGSAAPSSAAAQAAPPTPPSPPGPPRPPPGPPQPGSRLAGPPTPPPPPRRPGAFEGLEAAQQRPRGPPGQQPPRPPPPPPASRAPAGSGGGEQQGIGFPPFPPPPGARK